MVQTALFERIGTMKKVLVLIAIAFAIAAGATAFTIVNPNQAFACDDDHRGS